MERKNDGGRGFPILGYRGVAPRFRNFCITNEGDFFVDEVSPNGLLPPNPTDALNNVVLPGADPVVVQDPVDIPARSESASSTSSSPIQLIYEGPAIGRCFVSPPPADGIDVITIYSTSSDDEDLEKFRKLLPAKGTKSPQKANLGESGNDKVATSQENQTVALTENRPTTSSSVSGILPGNLAPPQNMGSSIRGEAVPQPPAANDDNGDEVYLPHKKFNYKTVLKCSAKSTIIKTEGNQSHQSTTTRVASKPLLSVDDLKLSPYITREQAEMRLKAIGNLEETQREIDSFAAVICTGSMFSMNLKEKAKSSNVNVNTARPSTSGGSTSGLSRHAQVQLPRQQMNQQTRIYPTDAGCMPAGVVSGSQQIQPTQATSSENYIICVTNYTSSNNLGCGGSVTNIHQLSGETAATTKYNEERGNSRAVEPTARAAAGGSNKRTGYFMATSPGQASVSDDYDWISD